MSQENVEIVRRCSEFWTSRDFAYLAEVADPEVVIDMSRNVFNPGVYRGLDGFRRFVEQVDEMWERFEAEVEELIDAGSRSHRRSPCWKGARWSRGGDAHFHRLDAPQREGVAVRGRYRDRSEALRAAGLQE